MESSVIDIEHQLKSSPILIVQCLDHSINSIAAILRDVGYSNINIAVTSDETFLKIAETLPELIILDTTTHGFNNHQICLTLQSHLIYKKIPLIAQINYKSITNRRKALDLGVDDFIGTPLLKQEVLTKVKMHILQNKILNKLFEFQNRLNYELEEARKMLFSLISKDNLNTDISNKYNLVISSYYKTSEELGGDYYAIKEVGDEMIASYIWDFSGHGISAAINTFRLHSLIQGITTTKRNPAEFLNQINHYLFTMLGKDQFATMFYSIIDLQSQKLNYAASGTPYPYLISFKHTKIKKLDTSGFPLGISENPKYKNHMVDFKQWDLLLFYSDALIETKREDDNLLDLENLLEQLLHQSTEISAINKSNWLFQNLIERFEQCYGKNLKDDLTICMIAKKFGDL